MDIAPATRAALRTGYDSEAVLLMRNPDGSMSAFRLQLDPLRTSTQDGHATHLSASGTVLASQVFEPDEQFARDAGDWVTSARAAITE